MGKLSKHRTESGFADYKQPYTTAQALLEAERCLYCVDAPCVQACPTGIDIPEFIRKISTGNLEGSARSIFTANIFGMSCARVCPVEVLCVGDCVYNRMGVPPIEIGKLQRYATDHAYDQGWRFVEAAPDHAGTRSIGLVGAGPASLACAHELRRLGHRCTLYEKRAVIGGLSTAGIAPYKLKADQALSEARWVLEIGGITVITEVAIGPGGDLPWAELEARHHALFLGIGLGPDRLYAVPGTTLPEVRGAVDFIEAFKLGTVDLSKVERAVVIGGGNTAIDAVRACLGLGISQVTMVYRGDEDRMSGYRHEWAAARLEAAQVEWHALPVAFEGDGKLSTVRCARVDAQRKPLAGTEFELPADLALFAIGQSRLEGMLQGLEDLELGHGRLIVDAEGRTTRARYYAGGDCANGAKEVVNAVAEGRDAARTIDADLRTVSPDAPHSAQKDTPHA